jgi:hypothetical protein
VDILVIILVAIGFSVWTIRPLYNFFAKNKYILLDQKKYTVVNQVKAGLPAVAFYLLLLGFVLVPARVNEIINSGTTLAIVILEVILIFVLTRIDKYQTKYEVTANEITFRKKLISWKTRYTVNYKKTWFLVLHKPRFIIKSNVTKITIPVLSKNISKFVDELYKHDHMNGDLVNEIIENARLYYIKNPKLQKQLNKTV